MRSRKRQITKENICVKVVGPAKQSWDYRGKDNGEKKDPWAEPNFCTLLFPLGHLPVLGTEWEANKAGRCQPLSSRWARRAFDNLMVLMRLNGIWSYQIRRSWEAKCLKRADLNTQHKFCPWDIYQFLNCAGQNTKKPSRKEEKSWRHRGVLLIVIWC